MFQKAWIFFFIVINGCLHSQSGLSKKELLALLNSPQHDTTLIDIYNELTWPIYSYSNADSSIYFAEKSIALSEKLGDLRRLSIAHRRIGITYTNTGDYKNSIHHEEESYRLSEKIGYRRGMHLALNNIGVAYLNNELFSKALTYFLQSLAMVGDDDRTAASVYANCGMIYRRMNDLERSKQYFGKALGHARVIKDNDLLVTCYSNMSTAYRLLGKTDSARYYVEKAGQYLTRETGNTTLFNYHLTEGLLLSQSGDHEGALRSFLATRKIATVANDEITILLNIAEEYRALNNPGKALEYFMFAYDKSRKNKMFNNLEYVTGAIASLYEKTGDVNAALRMMKLNVAYRDSNASVNRIQQIQRQQIEFDYARKQLADSLRFEQKERVKNLELENAATRLDREKIFRTMLMLLLFLIVLFLIFILNRFLITRKQKKIIEVQKQIVDVKNREMLDSINYAKRLQAAILPKLDDLRKDLDVNMLYLPKDIIGGDFYFYEKYNGYTYIGVCDCTGHGIPGAMMSVVCHHALVKAVREHHHTRAGAVLDETRRIVIESLNAGYQNIRDGMDCSLMVVNDATGERNWAGANNSLWYIHNNLLTEIRADKQPISIHENTRVFTTHDLQIPEGSTVYFFTDGYADQFGGPNAKKYKTKTLKEFLLTISSFGVSRQADLLFKDFHNWKGSLDQVDDVTIAILKV